MEAVAEKVDNTLLGRIKERFEENLPAHWKLTTLGEVFKWSSGGTPLRTNEKYYGGDIPWLVIGDLNDGLVTDAANHITLEGLENSAARWVEEGSVLLAMYGSIGKLGIAGRRLTTNQAIAFTNPAPNEAKYLYYFLMYSRHDLASLGKGATQKNISQAVIKAYPFPLAPLPEQRRIVSAIETQLGRLDAAVARLHAAKARLKRYKQAVLKAAVEGRLTEEWREKYASKYTSEDLLRDIHAEHRAIWEHEQLATFEAKGKVPKDGGWKAKYQGPVPAELEALPRLPDGWAWLRIGTIGFVTKLAGFEYTEYVKYDPDGDLAVIKAENASRDGFRRTEFSKVRSETVAHLTRSKLIPGDILIVFVGSIGNVARVPDDQPYFLGPNIGMIRVESKHVDPAYLEYYLRSPIGNHLINSFAKAVTQPSLSMGSIRLIPFAVPPIEEQRRIVDALEIVLEKQSEMESTLDAQLVQAGRLRQAVLKRAFEGRLV